MRKIAFPVAILLVSALAVAIYAQARAGASEATGPAPSMSAQGIVHGNHLLVLHDGMISIYTLDDLPRLTFVNAVELPASMAAARAMMAKAEAPAPAAQEGREVYARQQCSDCHRIKGSGGTVGPDLTQEGKTRSAAWIRQKITNPKASNPNSNMPAYQLPESQLDALVSYLEGPK